MHQQSSVYAPTVYLSIHGIHRRPSLHCFKIKAGYWSDTQNSEDICVADSTVYCSWGALGVSLGSAWSSLCVGPGQREEAPFVRRAYLSDTCLSDTVS